MIKIYNRQTKEYDIEKVAGGNLLNSLYGNGKLGLELLVKRKIYSAVTGIFCDMRLSAKSIDWFIKEYDIDMTICKDKREDYKTFNDFFTRRVKTECRRFDTNVNFLPSPGDGRLRAWMDIDVENLVQVKGMTYSLKDLIGDEQLAYKYNGGICLILRLAPIDYHRFHFVDSGICSESKKIKGWYYSVNPVALNSIPEVFCRNKREYSILHSENFGDVLYVEVGATSVGSIIQTYTPQVAVLKGEEKGYFKFGGSTSIIFIEKGFAVIDNDIIEQTEKGYETRVLAGEIIGRIKK